MWNLQDEYCGYQCGKKEKNAIEVGGEEERQQTAISFLIVVIRVLW